MKRFLLLCALAAAPFSASANPELVRRVVNEHILPGFERLRHTTSRFSQTASQTCNVEHPQLLSDYHAAFDAWIRVSHLRFGPTEEKDRAFALAFWPDKKGKTPRALRSLISRKDPAVTSLESFQDVTIAARGFFAMEYLLFDEEIQKFGDMDFQCALMQIIALDIAALSDAIFTGWENDYAALLVNAGETDYYRSSSEVVQELFKAAVTGYQFTIDARLGRPLGTFDKPRPKRAEARRSARSLRHVELATHSSTELSIILSGGNSGILDRYQVLEAYFAGRVERIRDPDFAGVEQPQARAKIEILQQAVTALFDHTVTELGPHLEVSQGFNALDGD